jgi:hypothetical protein
MDDPDLKLLLAILLVLVVAGTGWYFRDELLPRQEDAVVELPQETPAAATVEGIPKHPVEPYEPPQGGPLELVPLPPLDDSDAYFLLALADVFGAAIEPLLMQDAVIDRFVATVDNLPRNHVAEKIRPVGRLADVFRADIKGKDGPIYISAENYQRYDHLVSRIATADIDQVVDTYRRFYPLLQQSYQRLGYPNGYFNDRVIEVIDHLLATPRVEEPVELVRPHVLYEFADPDLEALSSGQKLLLRMGSEHAAVTTRLLRELRSQLAKQ